MTDRRDSELFQALERRRAENSRAMLLAPLLVLLAQPFLLIALGDENVGVLARLAVLVAGWAALLAAAWTVLRSRAREAQYETALEAAGAEGLRPESLERPRHHKRPEPPPPAPGATGLIVPPPPTPLPEEAVETPLPVDEPPAPAAGDEESSAEETDERQLPEGEEAETELFAEEGETELLAEAPPRPRPVEEIEEGEPQEEPPPRSEPGREREPWVRRWDHHVVWWASGSEHARPYMAWVAALGFFALADLAVLLATI